MPAGKKKQSYRGMDKPCRSSWIGAHETFQAKEYDAGASTTHQASQRMGQKEQLDRPAHILKYFGIVAPLFNEVVHKDAHLYCNGP
jgi:hypothetical protein